MGTHKSFGKLSKRLMNPGVRAKYSTGLPLWYHPNSSDTHHNNAAYYTGRPIWYHPNSSDNTKYLDSSQSSLTVPPGSPSSYNLVKKEHDTENDPTVTEETNMHEYKRSTSLLSELLQEGCFEKLI